MKSVGQAGGMPRTKAGDYERAWAVITAANGDLKTKAYLAELKEAEAAQVRGAARQILGGFESTAADD